MKIQLWNCDVCEVDVAVSDVPRVKVTCTGGHPQGRSGSLTAEHWPREMTFVSLVGIETGATVADVWETLSLPHGARFNPDDVTDGPSEAQQRAVRLSRYGWPESGS